jgi:hypothetical protein
MNEKEYLAQLTADHRAYKIPTQAERNAFRKTPRFKNTNVVWDYTFNKPAQVGSTSTLIASSNAKCKEEWVSYYFSQKPFGEFMAHSIKFWRALKAEFPNAHYKIKDALLIAFIHVIDETFMGKQDEIDARQLLSDCLVRTGVATEIREADQEHDQNFAVDLLVFQGKRLLFAIQVKPDSFFTDTPNDRVARAHRENKERNANFSRKYGVPVLYMNSRDIRAGRLNLVDEWKVLTLPTDTSLPLRRAS